MKTWQEIITIYINTNHIDNEIADLLLKTAKAADLMNEKFLEYKLNNLVNFCISEANNVKLNMFDEKKQALYPGYRNEDWLRFLQIPEISEERTQRQQIMNQINKGAVITNAIQSGILKDIKLVEDIRKKSNNLGQPTFVYMNAESLFADTKKRLFQKCPNCKTIFLTEHTINIGEEEYLD